MRYRSISIIEVKSEEGKSVRKFWQDQYSDPYNNW